MRKVTVTMGVMAAFAMIVVTGTPGRTVWAAADTKTETKADTETELNDSGILIAYYSATGNTKSAAEMIAKETGGELLELQPVEEYTDADLNYNDDSSRVCKEYADESLRTVELKEDSVENWEDIQTVYVGYPIWWGIAAWPVNQFVENNDFTGKTVIPFCTSASSGLGDSGKLLEEMAGTGEWIEGERFSSNVSEDDVKTWLDDLELPDVKTGKEK